MKISISDKNSKMGRIPSISLTPGESCPAGVPCLSQGCYALKAYKQYPATRAAYDRNLAIYRQDPDDYFSQVLAWLDKARPDYFRWHVAGDIPDGGYIYGMDRIAVALPGTRFLAFTKRYNWFCGRPGPAPNLTIVWSAWPGLDMPKNRPFPVAWMDNGQDGRIPADALPCPGNCENCGMCWSLPELGRDVVFKKH